MSDGDNYNYDRYHEAISEAACAPVDRTKQHVSGVGRQAAVKMLMAESVTAVFSVKNTLLLLAHLPLCDHLQSELMLLREREEPLNCQRYDSLSLDLAFSIIAR